MTSIIAIGLVIVLTIIGIAVLKPIKSSLDLLYRHQDKKLQQRAAAAEIAKMEAEAELIREQAVTESLKPLPRDLVHSWLDRINEREQ